MSLIARSPPRLERALTRARNPTAVRRRRARTRAARLFCTRLRRPGGRGRAPPCGCPRGSASVRVIQRMQPLARRPTYVQQLACPS